MALKNEYDLTTNKRPNAETAAHLTLICLYYESDFFPFVYGFLLLLLLLCSYRSLLSVLLFIVCVCCCCSAATGLIDSIVRSFHKQFSN